MKQVGNLEIEESWYEVLKLYFDSSNFSTLDKLLEEEKKKYKVYPPTDLIFNAYNSTPFEKVKVVILGQDPYHGEGQGNGLCFSVNEDIPFPPSLKNIFTELDSDLTVKVPEHGNLQSWADQGVLLLNTYLTVREGQPLSHSKLGWEALTNYTITQLSFHRTGLVFLLWGKHAQKKGKLIDSSKHYILTAAHPSPFSANTGFFGCRHFSETNRILEMQNVESINWEL